MDLILLAAGQTADVFAIDYRTVRRRYRQPRDVSDEAAIMRHVHALGFPTPAVHDIDIDRGELVIDRLHGPTMAEALLAGETTVTEAGRVLASLLHELHTLPPLSSLAAGTTVVHLDLHPQNVILTSHGPVVIDWCNARNGRAATDVAMSALIIAEVALAESSFTAIARELLAVFLDESGGVDGDALTAVVAQRTADPNVAREQRERIPAAARLVTQ